MRHELGIAAAAVALIASQAKAQATDAEIRQILVERVDVQHKSVLRPSLPLDKPRPLKVHKETAVDLKLFDIYAGRYRPSPDWVYTVTREDDTLRIQLPAAPRFRLHPESERDFFIRETDDIQVTFETDGQGRPTGLILHIWGFDVPAPRIEAAGGKP